MRPHFGFSCTADSTDVVKNIGHGQRGQRQDLDVGTDQATGRCPYFLKGNRTHLAGVLRNDQFRVKILEALFIDPVHAQAVTDECPHLAVYLGRGCGWVDLRSR